MKTLSKLWSFLALASVLTAGAVSVDSAEPFADGVVDEAGAIRMPADFRTDYVMLGAWSVAGDADTGAGVGLHVVYTPREAVDHYRETGLFPDGAVLVKELFSGHTADLTTGSATRADGVAGYFVMVKDTTGRFPGNPLWGDGWGWSFFAADKPTQTTSTDYQNDCLGCHEPVRDSDLVYTQGYPVLHD